MKSIASGIGIDVSKGRLDVKVPGLKAFAHSNTVEGIQEILCKLPDGLPVIMESSGGFERLAVKLLRTAGFTVKLLNPHRAKQFASSMGCNAKTDPLDAEFLGLAGVIMPTPIEKTQERQALCDHSRRIQKLKCQLEGVKKQMQSPELDSIALESLKRTEAFFEGEIKLLEKLFVQRVKTTEKANDYKLVNTVPGVGPVTARIAVSELPANLDNLTARQIASYAGLAPMDNSSGKRIGPKRIHKGNKHLKAALYVPAMNCVMFQPWGKELYTKLKAKGKKHQSAVVAVMRRLLMRIIAVLKRGTPWEKEMALNT
jgi:transposase